VFDGQVSIGLKMLDNEGVCVGKLRLLWPFMIRGVVFVFAYTGLRAQGEINVLGLCVWMGF